MSGHTLEVRRVGDAEFRVVDPRTDVVLARYTDEALATGQRNLLERELELEREGPDG